MILDVLFVLLLVGILPLVSLAQARIVMPADIQRIPAYLASAATLVVLGAAALLVGLPGLGPAEMGLWPPPRPIELASWTAALTLGGVAILFLFRWIGMRAGIRESDLLTRILPRTGRERRVFAGLSLAAGTGEELAYRGYLIPALQLFGLGPWGAALLASGVFGLLHAYQGMVGIVRTALLGFFLAISFLLSGSLWAAMLAHTFIDLLAGLVLAPYLGVASEPSNDEIPG